jgi:hypothetical protein
MGLLGRKLEDDDDDDDDGDNNNNNNNVGSLFGKGRQYNTQRGRKIIECFRVVLYCPCIMLILLKTQRNALISIYTHLTISIKVSPLFYLPDDDLA